MTVKAAIIKDSETGSFTGFLLDHKGGPIISAESIENLKTDFLKAWKACYAMSCLLRFSTHQDFQVFDESSIQLPTVEFIEL